MAYQTAWTIAHKLRHGLSEERALPLSGLIEADETFIGSRGYPASPGRSTDNPDKSLVVVAIEKVPAPKNKGKHGHAVKRQHGLAGRHAPRCQRQAPAPLASRVAISLQPTQPGRRTHPLAHQPRRRMRHHLL